MSDSNFLNNILSKTPRDQNVSNVTSNEVVIAETIDNTTYIFADPEVDKPNSNAQIEKDPIDLHKPDILGQALDLALVSDDGLKPEVIDLDYNWDQDQLIENFLDELLAVPSSNCGEGISDQQPLSETSFKSSGEEMIFSNMPSLVELSLLTDSHGYSLDEKFSP